MLAKAATRDPLRTLLRNAQARRTECASKVQAAQQQLQQAERWLAQKQELLQQSYGTLDEKLRQQRLQIERRFISAGGSGTREPVSPDLLLAVQEREAVNTDVQRADEAVKSFAGDVTAAKAALSKAEQAVAQSALAILQEHAVALGKKLIRHRLEALAIQTQLQGLGDCWLGGLGPNGEPQPVKLSLETQRALDWIEPLYPVLNPPRRRTALA